MAHLPDDLFRTVLEATPLVAIDLLVRRADGRYLLGWRNNRPAARHWFVPGGRILKNEPLAVAFARITGKELGAPLDYRAARLVGAYDHLYADTVFGDGDGGSGTHYVALGHLVAAPPGFEPRADAQHARFAWMTPDEILAHPEAHANARAYFPAAEARFAAPV